MILNEVLFIKDHFPDGYCKCEYSADPTWCP
jgi:hypothetical protein